MVSHYAECYSTAARTIFVDLIFVAQCAPEPPVRFPQASPEPVILGQTEFCAIVSYELLYRNRRGASKAKQRCSPSEKYHSYWVIYFRC